MNKNKFNAIIAAIACVLMFSGCGEAATPAQTAENNLVSNTSDKPTLNDALTGRTKENLLEYLRLKADNHNCYKIYSSIKIISSWLETGYLYLSDGSTWNDINDRNRFNPSGSTSKRFGFCCSFSKSENVAMWMLYGGISQNGTMMNIKKGQMNKIIESVKSEESEVELGYFDNDVFKKIGSITKSCFEVYRQDILYYDESDIQNGTTTIKRSDERCENVPFHLVDSIPMIKAYPWSYENECRLIVEIPDYKAITYNLSQREVDKCNTIAICIPECVLTELKDQIYCSPNFNFKYDCKEIQFNQSKLGTSMEWNLCNGCTVKKYYTRKR